MKKVKLKKRKNKLRFKRKLVLTSTLVLLFVLGIGYSLLSVDLNIFGNITVKKHYGRTLYEVLQKEAEQNGSAKEYTGVHQDSMDSSQSTKKIYHWYSSGTSRVYANAINNKNNVIFANHCWQMIRTTDTGGVKLLYNGEPENEGCLNNRGNHVGYGGISTIDFSATYYYGTSYIYDSENGLFKLSGDVTTGSIKTGQYTCRSTSENDSCSTLYLVFSLYNGTRYYAVNINNNAQYQQFGKLGFSSAYYYLFNVGLMENSHRISSSVGDMLAYIQDSNFTLSSSYTHYGDGITYDTTTNKYSLVDAHLIADLDDKSELVGKYFLSSGSTNPSDTAYYGVYYSGNSIGYKRLENGNTSNGMVCGGSYTNNNNGTYTVNNPTVVDYADWRNGRNSTCYNRYACEGTNPTCSNLYYISNSSQSNKYFYYYSTEKTSFKYGSSVSYQNGVYTLTGEIKTMWNTIDSENKNNFINHHYSCFSNSTTCNKVGFVFAVGSNYIEYVELEGESDVNELLENLLYADDININDSLMNFALEKWYKKYLDNYSLFIEDTIYCNDRSIFTYGNWSPNGNPFLNQGELRYKSYDNKDLSCNNITDRFSVSNNKAKLDYPIGLITASEVTLPSNQYVYTTGEEYWTMSPYSTTRLSDMYLVDDIVSLGLTFQMSTSYGVRPVISLKPGTEYAYGDGSMEEPYFIDTSS